MRISLCLLLVLLHQQGGRSESPEEEDAPTYARGKTENRSSTKTPAPARQPSKSLPPNWLLQECLKKNYTHLSCSKVFCQPWRRCISGKCLCKLPYQCPRVGITVCGQDNKSYQSYCHAQAAACRSNKPVFSHFGVTCKDPFEVHLEQLNDSYVVQVKSEKGKYLVCGKSWNIAAANVVCRQKTQYPRGAAASKKMNINDIKSSSLWSSQCISVQCTGSELSLAECTLYQPQSAENTEIATATCYTDPEGQKECPEFTCVNSKCIPWKNTCDGMDHCGDNSDEMCCKRCKKGFLCKSGVCISNFAVQDGIRDCLGGEDEVPGERPKTPAKVKPTVAGSHPHAEPERGPAVDEKNVSENLSPPAVDEKNVTDSVSEVKPAEESILSSPKDVIQQTRNFTENQLQCGIPNMEYVFRTEDDKQHRRKKRVVGGEEALPTQIQWQVAVQEEGRIDCGGVYLGGCWVLTAAHCVRPKPEKFKIKFSLWKKHFKQQTSDIVPVKNIIIHENYNSQTYQNDIALVQLEELAHSKECLYPNPAVRSVCVPWSTQQFQHGDTCTISGWGRNKEGHSAAVLKWANVTIIEDCKKYYNERFFDGMECAGDLAGSVDSCQGDSGGPLVCKDTSGLSFVWGIVSWGEKCGEENLPGVYTKVAHYFEWIRFNTGWSAVTKYNN